MTDEIEYSQKAVEKARAHLSPSALSQLIQDSRFTEVVERLEELGRERHFLHLSTPRAGDLNILYDPALDRAEFARRILELLHGEGSPHERLERYAGWVSTD